MNENESTTNTNNASTMIVALVAILVIVAVGFMLYRGMPATNTTGTTPAANVDVNLPAAGNTTNP
jgi:hypothetical protein